MIVKLVTSLFYLLLLFLLMCSTSCEYVFANNSDTQLSDSKNTVDLFTDKKISGAKGPEGEPATQDVDVKDYYSPIILLAGDVFVTLAGVNCEKNPEKTIDIITNYTQKNKLSESEEGILSINKDSWITQFAVQNKQIEEANKVVKGLLAAAKGNKIYLLSVIYTKKTAGDLSNFNFAIYFADGTVDNGEPAKKIFKWKDLKLNASDVADKLQGELKDVKIDDFLFSGSAFLLDEEKIVFALVANDKQKNMSALIQLKDNQIKLKLVNKEIFENCQPYFFSWNKKIIMVPADCDKKRIKELGNIEGEWSDCKETLFSHYGFLKDKHNFVTIKNGTTEILLFAEHLQTTTNFNLWMSDGIRLKNIGKIASDVGETVTPVNFLFTDCKLFSLNKQMKSSKNEIESVKLKYLKQESRTIISTINAWKNTDSDILILCREQKASKIPCSTDGLVGFLFGTGSNDGKWKDKYFFEDATVTPTGSDGKRNADKIDNGFKFSGEGAGAKWEVGKANKDQQYKFTDPGFTLVATVKINDITEGNAHNSVLGVVFQQLPVGTTTANNIIGLLCNAEKKWTVSNNAKAPLIKTDKGCVVGKKYSVALVLREQKLEIYVDGEQLIFLKGKTIEIKQAENKIDHFYFGASTVEASGTPELQKTAVTITNVFLYNRPLKEEDEIKKLKLEQIKVDTKAQPGSDSINQQTPKENTDKTGTQPDTSVKQTTTEKKDKQSSSSPPTTEDSAARVGVVGVLCFMSFGVFTLLGRYVY